ncbi:MAG: ComEC/Rec2 family competence protein [Ruminococcaceae bacterium]|nr:ComEC/Rec2 family competence protein [Oscillospiraceae bacterium]
MEYLKHRPLLTVCTCFAGAAFCLRLLSAWGKLICLLLFAVSAAALILLRTLLRPGRKPSLSPVLPILIGLFAGCLSSWLWFDVHVADMTARDGEQGTLTATVTDVTYTSDYLSLYTAKAEEWKGEAVSFSVLLEIPRDCDAEVGDLITLSVTLSLPPEEDNGFPTRSYYASDGIFLVATGDEEGEVAVTPGNGGIASRLSRLSSALSARLRLLFDEERGGFLSGILLGRRDDVTDNVKRDFRFLGLSHILAVSGLHLSVLVGGLLIFIRIFRAPPWLQLLSASVMIVFFAALTGFPASVLRSGIMLFLTLVAFITGERYDPPTALALAAALILLLSPNAVTDVGFLLSVSATAGIIALGSPLASFLLKKTAKSPFPIKLLGKALAAMAVTVSAVFFTLPFSAWYFGECSLVSPFSNLLFLPLTGTMLLLALLTLLLYGTPLAGLFAASTGDLAGLLLHMAEKLAARVIEPISLRFTFTLFAFFLSALAFLMLFLLGKKRLVTLLVPIVVFSAVFGGSYALYRHQTHGAQSIVAVNILKNDYLLLHENGKTLLCDMSDGSYSNLKSAAALSSAVLNDSSPDGLFLTHLHRKHINSFVRLADNHRLSYLLFPSPYDETTDEVAEALTREAEKRGVTVIPYSSEAGGVIAFGGFTLTTTPIGFLDRSVQPLCSLTVKGNGTLVYLGAGMTESPLWEQVLPTADSADLTLLGIHGPNVKVPLASPPGGTVLVSNSEGNEAYGTAYDRVRTEERFYRLILFQKPS